MRQAPKGRQKDISEAPVCRPGAPAGAGWQVRRAAADLRAGTGRSQGLQPFDRRRRSRAAPAVLRRCMRFFRRLVFSAFLYCPCPARQYLNRGDGEGFHHFADPWSSGILARKAKSRLRAGAGLSGTIPGLFCRADRGFKHCGDRAAIVKMP